ncbi:nucleotidyltransferase family protein [Paracoccus laeviglucosivorans]|uniref:MurNAc alpha-1-phosphate uridylyltransferase n=1 Tax=Paracoccus laeviglucosivorans TaxID=1197861 RepID=A0A521DKC4_9RHOB|nr:nucleotidyltransferase family protein [Paracoccus laeviglucosivorans]SMO72183.1 MurNAc alpha-1-phosphate uridylyltransferase [Paracoccus laeviglucosivorans]
MTLPLMIFAAGKGTRMAPLTDVTPKPMIRVGGRTLLDRALDMGGDAGVGRVVVNTHHLGCQIRDHLAGSDVAISDEADALLETGGGLRKALPLLGPGPVVTVNPDVVWTGGNPIVALLSAWRDDMDALLMLVPLAQTHGRQGGGDFSLDPAGRLIRKGDLVYGGAQIIRPDRLAEIPEDAFSLNRLWDLMIADSSAYGITHPGQWCDVGRPDCIPLAEGLLHG